MSSEIFKQLYESSKLLVAPNAWDRASNFERGIDLVDTETRLLFTNNKANLNEQTNAHFFLARNGINSQDLAQELETVDTHRLFEANDSINDIDVEKCLQQAHERIIIDTIEECRHNACVDFEDCNERVMEINWNNVQRQILEEWDHHQDAGFLMRGDNSIFGNSMPEPLRRRIADYAGIVSRLNDARVQGNAFPLVEEFSKLTKPSDSNRFQARDMATDAWELIDILAEEGIRGSSEVFPAHIGALNARRKLIGAAKRWLEKQFVQYIDYVLYKNAIQIPAGGGLSPAVCTRAFMRYTFRKNAGWTDPRFEIVNDTPIWTYVYLLIRSGHDNIALEYVEDNKDLFSTEPRFIQYFREYVESPEKRLRKATRDAVLADYQQLEYGQRTVDPYKLIIYKIIGRCELSKKSNQDVIKSTEDYMWLQLTLVRESTDAEEFGYERYRLSDLQKMMTNIGPKRFDPDGNSPFNYFKVLLLTLQFERAIDYLYKNEKSRIEAVHFAIALAYHGLLHIPEDPLAPTIDLLVSGQDGQVKINFARLIYQYSRLFSTADPKDTLQYFYLLSLYSDQGWYDTEDMIMLCRQYVRELVLGSKEPLTILGTRSAEFKRNQGLLDQHKKLMGITSERSYVESILLPVAEKYAQDGQLSDAIADYNLVMDILNKQLGDALQQSCTSSDQALQQPQVNNHLSDEYIVNLALSTLKNYENQQHIGALIEESKKNTVFILINLLRCRSLYYAGAYEQALQLVRETNVIPFENKYGQVKGAAKRFTSLDVAITKNIPDILLMVTDMLYKLWEAFTGSQSSIQPAAKQTLERIEENIRSVLSFIGMIQYKMPADMVTKLNSISSNICR
ncbi:Nup93/Nic96-domain-containing protein [Dichotomocladium elegans]|nr:Nup93/Nic96-domain-containing protein [Dichotomocladium elegans]